MVRLILYVVAGAVIFSAVQYYVNREVDKAVEKTIIKVSKQIAAEKEKEVSVERKKLSEAGLKLEQKEELLSAERVSFEAEKKAFNGAYLKAIENAQKAKEIRYVQIREEVANIPGNELDDSIRGILARYNSKNLTSP
jgi:hypothetical protein